MLQFAQIALGTGGHLGCVRCTPSRAAEYLPSGDLVSRIHAIAEGWSGGPGPNVILGGPEPFAHPELPALVAACVEAGIERICLETDGGALSVPANASGVLHAGVRHLRVRMLAADEVLADDLSGVSGRARDTLAGIGAYLAAAASANTRVAVSVTLPVCEHNLAALPASVGLLARHGVDAVRFVLAGALPVGAGAIIAAACDTGMVNQLWVEADPALPLPVSHAAHAVPGEVFDG